MESCQEECSSTRTIHRHTSTVAMAAIQNCGFQLVEDPTYSPDLAQSSRKYYLFPKIKKELDGHHFAIDDNAMNTVDQFLRDQKDALLQKGYVCSMTVGLSVLM